jgi:hypothetical protein
VQRETAEELLASFCTDLRSLWIRANGPSLRVLECRLRLGKSQLGAILAGHIRRPPEWQVVAGLVKAIGEYAADRGRTDRLPLPTGITEYWRPRFAVLEHAFSQSTPRAAESAATARTWVAPAQLPHALPTFAGRVDALARLDSALPADGVVSVLPSMVVVLCGTAGVGKPETGI